jgi:phosphatidylglycerophosphate synthase
MKVFDTDRYVYTYVIDPVSVHFKNINPNWITILSMPLSFCIFLLNFFPPIGMIFAISTNILRTLCDFLDGHIARKYNKCTKLGGLLDTIADGVHSVNYVMFFVVTMCPSISLCYFILLWSLIFGVGFSLLWTKGLAIDHDKMGNLGTSPLDIFIALGKYDGLLLNLFMLSSLILINQVYG